MLPLWGGSACGPLAAATFGGGGSPGVGICGATPAVAAGSGQSIFPGCLLRIGLRPRRAAHARMHQGLMRRRPGAHGGHAKLGGARKEGAARTISLSRESGRVQPASSEQLHAGAALRGLPISAGQAFTEHGQWRSFRASRAP